MQKLFLTLAIACMVCGLKAQEGLQIYKKTVDGKERLGIADAKGNPITPAKYGWIDREFSEGFIAAYIPELKTVDNSNLAFAPAKTGYYWWNNYGYIDVNGKELVPFKYDEARPFNNGVAKVRLSKWGLINKQGREITPFKYDDIKETYSEEDKLLRVYEIVMDGKKKYGLLSTSGKEMTAAIYDQIKPFQEGLAIMNRNGMMGVIDMQGKEIAAPRYSTADEASGFVDGLCRVNWNGKYGYIDKTGREVIPLVYDRVYGFTADGTSMARQGDYTGRIDKTGKVVVPFKYGRVDALSDGTYLVKQGNYFGWVDQSGKELIAPSYEYASSFVGGYAYVRMGKNFGVVNKNNEMKIPLQYESIGRWSDTKPLLYFKRDNKYAFFSETLTELTPPRYTTIYNPVQGRGFVRIGNKWGAVNEKGREIVEVKYDTLMSTDNGSLIVAVMNQKVGVLDNAGTVIIPIKYDDLFGYSEGMCPVLLNNKYGYVNEQGKEVIAPQFDNVGAFVEGKAKVLLGGQTFFIDKTGKKIG